MGGHGGEWRTKPLMLLYLEENSPLNLLLSSGPHILDDPGPLIECFHHDAHLPRGNLAVQEQISIRMTLPWWNFQCHWATFFPIRIKGDEGDASEDKLENSTSKKPHFPLTLRFTFHLIGTAFPKSKAECEYSEIGWHFYRGHTSTSSATSSIPGTVDAMNIHAHKMAFSRKGSATLAEAICMEQKSKPLATEMKLQ
ncbi:hypothetical protein MJT46_015493 [Ovis ammon polii x Ovis aries]|nr:hypothetical protein MJT46_015493 [Ovis ammon polii x Ovis aries]